MHGAIGLDIIGYRQVIESGGGRGGLKSEMHGMEVHYRL